MGLYRRLFKNTPVKKGGHTPLPLSAHVALAISLILAILSLLVPLYINKYNDYSETNITTIKATTATTINKNNINNNNRQSTLHTNKTYNFDTTFCNIQRIQTNKLTRAAFISEYAGKQPVILVNDQHNKDFRQHVTKESIITNYGLYNVILSASNSYTKHKKTVSVKEYVETMMKQQTIDSLGNETWYLFGDNYGDEWTPLLNLLQVTKYAGKENTLSFGIGGKGSGVPFHFHGGGFSEVFHGRKRWFLTSHENIPKFNPDHSMLQWVHKEYWKLYKDNDVENIYECTIGPGEILYFPSQWHHGVLNLDHWTSFVSTFTLGEELLGSTLL
jgi:ribosomal protein L16 Arg81 hydroxylase